MTQGSLCSGIGAFDLAAEWMGWENIFHCDNDPFCSKLLKHYWPKAKSYGDIKTTDFTIHRREIDVLTAGFPCQPFSVAGKQEGSQDVRYLWPETLRSIREIQSRWVVLENVYGLLTWSKGMVFEQICSDLEDEGYQVAPFILPACAVGAVHRRDRIFWVAFKTAFKEEDEGWICTKCKNPVFEGCGCDHGEWECGDCGEYTYPFYYDFDDGCSHCGSGNVTYAFSERGRGGEFKREYAIHADPRGETIGPYKHLQRWAIEPPVRRKPDGVSRGMDRIKALGNAIVPQVAYEIFKAIESSDRSLQ